MPEGPEDFDALMRRLRDGSAGAARLLFERYGHHVRRVVRRRLSRKLRSKFDSEDFTQAVWASFFAEEPRKYRFDRPEELVAFLVVLAQNKVLEVARQRLQTRKHDVSREQPLHNARTGQEAPVIARQDTPSEVAMGQEQWDRLLEGQPPRYRRALEMLRQGHTHREVALELGVSEKTIQRLLRRLLPETGL